MGKRAEAFDGCTLRERLAQRLCKYRALAELHADQRGSGTLFDLGSGIGKISGRLAILKLFDRVYELRDGSGIGVGAPQFGARRTFVAGLTKTF